MRQQSERWDVVRLGIREATPEEEEELQRFLDVWEWVGTKGLVPSPYGKAEDVLDKALLDLPLFETWKETQEMTRENLLAMAGDFGGSDDEED